MARVDLDQCSIAMPLDNDAMLSSDALILRWARNGAAAGAGLAIAGLLVPSEIGGYLPPISAAALLRDAVAIFTAVLVGALVGAAIAAFAENHRRRSGHRSR